MSPSIGQCFSFHHLGEKTVSEGSMVHSVWWKSDMSFKISSALPLEGSIDKAVLVFGMSLE